MRTSIIILILLFLTRGPLFSAPAFEPQANPAACVTLDQVRFTVLLPEVIRLEWSKDGVFEDRASLVFVQRHLPVPPFEQKMSEGWLELRTDKLHLKYKPGSGKFKADNLQIEFTAKGKAGVWKPGLENTGNLKGTARTLDGYDGMVNAWSKRTIDLGEGLLSRSGWTLVDDSERPLFDNSDWPWVTPRPAGARQDWYFLAYGSDYKLALRDFTQIAGPIPLPPRFAFGSWWSRYWEYTDWELRELVADFTRNNVPLDVLVVDMDWHLTSRPEWYQGGKKLKDQAGEDFGWTGFTWNRNYFPNPAEFLHWTEQQGLKVCLNLHPASGIQPHEEQYPAMAQAMGIDPNSQKYVPFDIVNKNFAENFLKLVLAPMEAQGIDFWWLDWQQWSTTSLAGVNPTFYLNYVFFTNMERQQRQRPLIFHRYGGLGNHRYQIGFSGDTFINWRSLDFQPYFTTTAANVGFGYWSHDIGGHMSGESTPELYTRWIQFGAFSPILRTHCTKDPRIERRIWAYPRENFQAMRDAFQLRYRLIPYIYTAARHTYETGVALCRPLYYDYPETEFAYQFKNQYFFGDDLLAAPITRPLGADSLYLTKQIWLPPGEWYEWHSGACLTGDRLVSRAFTLADIPLYVKAGAIIPMQPDMRYSNEKPVDPLILNIFPGVSGQTRIYDDAGNSLAYQQDQCTWTEVHFTRTGNTEMEVVIAPIRGSFPEMIQQRGYEIRLVLTLPPTEVTVNGQTLNFLPNTPLEAWEYDGDQFTTIVHTGRLPVQQPVVVKLKFPDQDPKLLAGKQGQIRNLLKFAKVLANHNWDKSKYSNDRVVYAAQTGLRLSLNPASCLAEIQQFDRNWPGLVQMLQQAMQEQAALRPAYALLKISQE